VVVGVGGRFIIGTGNLIIFRNISVWKIRSRLWGSRAMGNKTSFTGTEKNILKITINISTMKICIPDKSGIWVVLNCWNWVCILIPNQWNTELIFQSPLSWTVSHTFWEKVKQSGHLKNQFSVNTFK
jgi:hypothetical protein